MVRRSDGVRHVRTLPTAGLSPAEAQAIRRLLDVAFADDGEGFSDADWAHTLNGIHAIAEIDGRITAHAAVVERALEVNGWPLRVGYIEGVATLPGLQGQGHGSAAMLATNGVIEREFELGALSTGLHGFYARLGWERWRGRTGVRTSAGFDFTPDDDDGIMILRTPSTPAIDLGATLTCDWREGDVW